MTRTQKRKQRKQVIEAAFIWLAVIALSLVAFFFAYLGATL